MTIDSLPTAESQPSEVAPEAPEIDPTRLDADAVRVLLRLRQHGYEAYLVGGCVRDLLVGRTPKDFDIATSATPNQVRGLFRNCRLIGRRFRLAHIYFRGGKILEVSTFRALPSLVEEPQPSEAAEGEVHSRGTDSILHADEEALSAVERGDDVPSAIVEDVQDEMAPPPGPDVAAEVVAAAEPDLYITEDNTFGTALQDACRRDFTINGLFYDPMAGKVLDYVNGLRDLAMNEIRTIGDPETRMREDPVRILRAVRFAVKLEFDIESRTYAAMEGAVDDLTRCSAPRLLEETFRLIRGGQAAAALKLVHALDALKVLLPPIAQHLAELGEDRSDDLWRFLRAMDEVVAEGATFDDSMLLAAMLLPLSLKNADRDEGDAVAPVAASVENLLNDLVRTSRLPRRIAERCRMILIAQHTLTGKRRRRHGLMSFRAHPLFREALAVFDIWVRATGDHREALELWKSGRAPSVASDALGPKRARKRRRRTVRPVSSDEGATSENSSADETDVPAVKTNDEVSPTVV